MNSEQWAIGRAGHGVAGALLVIALLAPMVRADVVERREAAEPLHGAVIAMDDAGVQIRSESGASHLVPWDRVRDVRLERTNPRLAEYLPLAETLWRARSRLERNDPALAEPLLERLFGRFRGQSHETALVVSEGLLRCRLARGEQAAALLPALEVIRLRRAGIATDSYSMLQGVYDADLALCPYLPPVWLPSRWLESLTHDLRQYDAAGDPVVDALRTSYLRSIRRALREEEEGAAPPGLDHAGVDLVEALVQCTSADGATGAAARRRLEGRARGASGWVEAWARFGVGMSLLAETEVVPRQQGLVSLAHLPARFSRTHRYLSAVALGAMVRTLHEMGDARGAAALRTELERSAVGASVSEALRLPQPTPHSVAPAAVAPPAAAASGKVMP